MTGASAALPAPRPADLVQPASTMLAEVSAYAIPQHGLDAVLEGAGQAAFHSLPFFPGWVVVAGAFLVGAVGYGAAYSFVSFAHVLEQEFAASQSLTSLVYSTCGVTAFGISAVSGPLADRIGCRLLAGIGMLLVGLGLCMSALATDLVQIVLSYGLLIGLGVGLSYVPAVAAVQRWFVVRRGLVSGIASAGIGFATALVPLVANAMIAGGGWRHALLMMGVVAAVLGIAGAMLLLHSPEHYGLLPDGGVMRGGPQLKPAYRGVRSILGGQGFARLYLGCFAISIPLALPFAYLPASAQERGLAWGDALALLSLIGFGSVVGRFVLGMLADRAGRSGTFLACCWGVAAATAWWAVADGSVALSIFALVFGVAYGGFIALWPAFIVDLYGRALAGSALGVLHTSRALALLAGPFLMMATRSGPEATVPLLICAVAGAGGTVLLTLAAPAN